MVLCAAIVVKAVLPFDFVTEVISRVARSSGFPGKIPDLQVFLDFSGFPEFSGFRIFFISVIFYFKSK